MNTVGTGRELGVQGRKHTGGIAGLTPHGAAPGWARVATQQIPARFQTGDSQLFGRIHGKQQHWGQGKERRKDDPSAN